MGRRVLDSPPDYRRLDIAAREALRAPWAAEREPRHRAESEDPACCSPTRPHAVPEHGTYGTVGLPADGRQHWAFFEREVPKLPMTIEFPETPLAPYFDLLDRLTRHDFIPCSVVPILPAPPARRWGEARFTIRRLPIGDPSARPWKVTDADDPHWIGDAPTHESALAIVDRRVAEEALAGLGWTEVGYLAELDHEAAGERHEERKREDRHA